MKIKHTKQAKEIIDKSCGDVVDYVHGAETMVHWRVRDRLIVNIAAALAELEASRPTPPGDPNAEADMGEALGFGEIVMMSEQRNKPGLPSRWCALARGRREAAYADSEEEARIAALALPRPPQPEKANAG